MPDHNRPDFLKELALLTLFVIVGLSSLLFLTAKVPSKDNLNVLGVSRWRSIFETLQSLRADRRHRPTPTVTPRPSVSTTPTPIATIGISGLPLGPFYVPENSYNNPYTGGFLDASKMNKTTLDTTLKNAQKAKVRLIMTFAGNRGNFQKTDGSFDLAKHQKVLADFKASHSDLTPYVKDGTIFGELLFDEPQDPSNWNGSPVSFEDIDSAAKYSKSLWPTLATGAGTNPCFLKDKSTSWQYLDFTLTPFTAKRLTSSDCVSATTADGWMKGQVDIAKSLGLRIVLSINVLDGGTGSTASSPQSVTSSQLLEWGTLFINEPYNSGLTFWKYDSSRGSAYFSDPSISSAMTNLAGLAKVRTGISPLKVR